MAKTMTIEARKAAVADIQAALRTHTRANNRRKVLNALKEAKFLSSIPLDPVQVGDVEAAEQEVAADRVIVNGLKLIGSADRPSDVLEILRDVCRRLCDPGHASPGSSADGVARRPPPSPVVDPRDLYECLLFRMARAANAVDSHSYLDALIGSSDLSLLPRKERRSKLPPVEVEVFASSSEVHTSVSCPNVYGLFRKGDLKQQFGRKTPMPHEAGSNPWISIDAVVEERTNFASGDSVRYLRVRTLDGLRF